MTYYEWINTFDQLKDGPRNDEIINNLYKEKINLDGNILYRFIIHINALIRARLKNALESILTKIASIYKDTNLLSIEILNIKKELIFAKKIINLPVIPEENKNMFKKTLQNFANEIQETLEMSANNIDNTGTTLTLIRNSKINFLED